MPRLIVVLVGVLCLSCSSQAPIEPTPEQAALGELVSINGEAYRRVAAKQGETQTDYRITITIPVSTQPDGSLVLSNTIEVGGRTYTANCSATDGPTNPPTTTQSDDVGNTNSTARSLPLLYPPSGSTEVKVSGPYGDFYIDSRDDVDVFRINVSSNIFLGIASWGNTDVVGELYTSRGTLLERNDNGLEGDNNNFWLFGYVQAGIHYLKVRGVGSAQGAYMIAFTSSYPSSGKPVVEAASSHQEQLRQTLQP